MDSERQNAIDQEYHAAMEETAKKRKCKWIPWVCVILVLLALGAGAWMLWQTYQYGLQMQILGEAKIIHEYSKPYEDPGATATFDGFFYDEGSVPVRVDGTVDIMRLGEQELTYHAEYPLDLYFITLTCSVSQNRTVVVVDTQAPEIILETKPDYFTLPGGTYEEEGFVALDNHDGDITSLVERTQTEDQVTYRVTDASGNTTEVTRPIEYSDPIAPELTLKGASVIMLRKGKTYAEPGYTAQDNCDGDITQNVTVNGTVNGNKAGTYVLEYTVQDSYGNVTTATRTVIVDTVKAVPGLSSIPSQTPDEPNGRVIYLTFDDGPSSYTKKLLDVLDKYDVKATFFVIYANNVSTLQRMDAAGHTVGMHGDTHTYRVIYASEEAYFNDLYTVQGKIEAAIGYKPMLLRFPGGSSNTVSRNYCKGIMTTITKKVKELGFRYFDWNVDSGDTNSAKTSQNVYYNVARGAVRHKNAIVLQHDIVGFSVDAVEDIIKWGLINGYTFAPLTMDSPVCEFKVAN